MKAVLLWTVMSSPPPASSTRILAPALPVVPSRPSFPLVATLAPVLMSVVLWLVTRSPFALMFAALGPGIAVASLADARIGGRRRARAEEARFLRELEATRVDIAAEHDREREALARASPATRLLLDGPEPVRWGGSMPTELRLGRSSLRSGLALDGVGAIRGSDTASQQLRSIRDEAALLVDAPFLVPIGSGIGVTGPPQACAALARAIVVQLLAACSPAQYRVRGDAAWLDALPHAREPGAPGTVELLGERERIVIATARDPAALPATVETVVRVSGAMAAVSQQSFAPEFLSTEEALEWADRASAVAREHGLIRSAPVVAHFAELPASNSMGLSCAIGVGVDGPVFVDLIDDGPHAIVGGTTGSGKSELLITWLVSMARLHSPAELTILLFDFKGGSSFGDVVALPHCVGLVTDLDGSTAARAVASLAAELRYRERVLAAVSARSIEEVSDLPRLVIVVDEFAAMAADLPELHAAFADLAARGRSLGVHLVLCTQRPSGVVRDAVLANASLRISLRVNNRADSVAVIGTDAAGCAVPPGRAWLARAGEQPTELQVAIATREDIAAVVDLWSGFDASRRPWREPLPSRLAHSGVPSEIGLVDTPAEQSQPPLRWDPSVDGNLLALGGARAGRTTLLRAIAHASPAALVDADPEALWDAVLSPPATLLLIDDLDLLVARMPAEYQQAVTEQLALLMRANRTRVAITVQRLTGAIQPLGALCGMRLLLRMPNRQEHIIAGGSTQTFDPDLPPGGGYFGDARVQIALTDRTPEVARATSVPFAPRGLTLAVSPRASALAARLAAAGHTVTDDPSAVAGIVVTDLDGWHANWAAFNAAAKQHDVLFHDCSPAEFRQLSRTRTLPPLIVDPSASAWLLTPEGRIERVKL